MVYVPNYAAGVKTFRLDLPSSGDWLIRAAFGDGIAAQRQYVVFKDDTTSFSSYTGVVTGTNEFTDAAGTLRTQAAWPGSNSSITRTFSSSILRIEMGTASGSGSDLTTISHVYIEAVGSSATSNPARRAFPFPIFNH
jgi:hypothetical protein